jgi:hypothetical protein
VMEKRIVLPKAIGDLVAALMSFIKLGRDHASAKAEDSARLRIARYNLVLMDRDGQVVWTNEWDTGGIFEFGPRHRMWIFCEFTNHSHREAEIAEYEIELMSEEGQVVDRFGSSFGDSVIVVPGQSRVFPGQWQM